MAFEIFDFTIGLASGEDSMESRGADFGGNGKKYREGTLYFKDTLATVHFIQTSSCTLECLLRSKQRPPVRHHTSWIEHPYGNFQKLGVSLESPYMWDPVSVVSGPCVLQTTIEHQAPQPYRESPPKHSGCCAQKSWPQANQPRNRDCVLPCMIMIPCSVCPSRGYDEHSHE